jgi:hypothetical protein
VRERKTALVGRIATVEEDDSCPASRDQASMKPVAGFMDERRAAMPDQPLIDQVGPEARQTDDRQRKAEKDRSIHLARELNSVTTCETPELLGRSFDPRWI